MKYRKLDDDGDMTFGMGSNGFYIDIDAVRQAIQTRLELYLNSFWRALNDGIPMYQSILGAPGSASNLAAIDNIIQSRIAGTEGVLSVLSYSSIFDSATRAYEFTATVQTLYSETVVSGSF